MIFCSDIENAALVEIYIKKTAEDKLGLIGFNVKNSMPVVE